MKPTALSQNLISRKVIQRTRGVSHGLIVRLMSPSDLGERLKPFVFLDRFESDMRQMARSMPVHPHSGIGTITVFADGDVTFDDPQAGHGTIGYGGVEWVRAGSGMWHGKELSAGTSATVQGFQLWIALPPDLERAEPEAQYIGADATPSIGPARLILGVYGGATSPVRSPREINYLLVTLKPGECWTYEPPFGHTIAWTALAKGALTAGERLSGGEFAIFEDSEVPITFEGDGNEVVDTPDEAIAAANRTMYGLTSSILAGNTYKAFEMAPKVLAGIVNVNSPTVNDEIHAPRGGVRDSGWGRTGPRSLDDFSDVSWINSHSGQRQYPF